MGVAIVSGILLGAVFSGLVAQNTPKIIEKKGVFTTSLSRWLFLAGAIFISVGLLLLVFNTFAYAIFYNHF
jgi:hypothetical protein